MSVYLVFIYFLHLLELAKLDKTERRYAWIKRRMRSNEEIWKIFPSSWHVSYRLCILFCKKTRYGVYLFIHLNIYNTESFTPSPLKETMAIVKHDYF